MKKALCAILLAAPLLAHAGTVTCQTVGNRLPATFLATDHDDEIVHIRARPDTHAKVLVSCDNHGEVNILGKTGEWYHVRLLVGGSREIKGYVHQSQVSLRRAFTVYAREGFVYFRDEADINAPVQDKLNNGTVVVEYPKNSKGDWLFVGVSGTDGDLFGYVHKSGLRAMK